MGKLVAYFRKLYVGTFFRKKLKKKNGKERLTHNVKHSLKPRWLFCVQFSHLLDDCKEIFVDQDCFYNCNLS